MTLTIQDLGAIGELLGSVAVLATLVYLALQTRQNTMAIAAQLEAAALAANQNTLLSMATSNEIAEAMDEDRVVDVPPNQVRRVLVCASLLTSIQWQHHQGRRGLLPTFHERAVAGTVRNFFSSFRSFDRYWENAKGGFFPEFVEWVEEQRSKAA